MLFKNREIYCGRNRREQIQFRSTKLSNCSFAATTEATLWQTTLQWHLTTFKANFMVASCTGFLPFMPFTTGFTQSRTNAATKAFTFFTRSKSWT